MTRVLAILGLLAVAAAAPARAQESDEQKPSWMRALETANPYVSAGSDALGGASSSIEGTKALTTGQVSRELGNRAARRAAADAHNAARASGQGAVKAIERFHVGSLTTVADVGGTLSGLLAEGDFRAMPGVLVDTGVKNTVTAGGTWAMGGTGAAIGSAFGPLGTLIGGAIGAAAGAVGTSMGYDGANEALQRNGYRSVRGYVDSLLAEEDVAPVLKLLREREAMEKAREQDARNAEMQRGYQEQARQLGVGPGGAQEVELAAPPKADAAIPVIPDDCTIDVVMWTKASPSLKWRGSFQVRGDTVTGQGGLQSPPAHAGANFRQTAMVWVDEFTGTRRDNVISVKNRGTLRRVRQESGSADSRCVMEWWSTNESEEEWTFRLGGTGSVRIHGTGTTTSQYMDGCSDRGSQTQPYSISISNDQTAITWTIR